MRVSEAWLREWVDPPVDTETLAAQLTMAGLEVGSIDAAAPPFTGVVLGRVRAVEPHPDADKLRVCVVDTGDDEARRIVCGAPNVDTGQLVAVAEVGARLPGGLKIRRTKLRGIESAGMICSATELGLGEESDGILVLPDGGSPGTPLRDYLSLDDQVIEIELTPNRGDCLGLAGIAREVAVINRVDMTPVIPAAVPAQIDSRVPVTLEDNEGCPLYAGRVVQGIDSGATTPVWMQEKLRRGGIRPIHPVVDVTNYVMLETGQPMHAFDLRRLAGGVVVRRAREAEPLTLLDGRKIALDPDVLVIADQQRVRAIAGVMGGEDSGVGDDTTDIFFESAYFAPLAIAGRARRFGLHTDASHRFERGVAPGGQVAAIERATALLVDIAGGRAGPVEVAAADDFEIVRPSVRLRREQLRRLLGHEIPDPQVMDILTRLQMDVRPTDDGWVATPPPFRFDIEIEADLIEEVARIYGYDKLPETDAAEPLAVRPQTEARVPLQHLQQVLVARGYREAVTYSFVDPALHRKLTADEPALALSNPISSDLSVMRTSLWPGLIQALKLNLSRQQDRVRLFESGLRFTAQDTEIKQENMLAGVAYGDRFPEQWGESATVLDFYDVKGDVEAMLAATGFHFAFEAAAHPSLHPAQAARIRAADGTEIGWAGALHPAIQRDLGLSKPAFLFEILVDAAFRAKIPSFESVSRFPSLRRDVSFLVDEQVSAAQILDCIRDEAPKLLRDAFIFDVYRDSSIDSGRKSVALGLILQDYCSTLTDGEADAVVDDIRSALITGLQAKIRD